MAKVGRLRLRDRQLVVEGTAGEILARIEPDEHMRIETFGSLEDLLAGRAPGEHPRPITVTWLQVIDEGRGYIDVDGKDVIDVPEVPQLP